RTAVVLTTEECELDREAIEQHLFERCGFPHFERNVFHPDDLRGLFGQGIDLRSQLTREDPPNPGTADAVREWAQRVTTAEGMVEDGIGVVMVAPKSGVFDRERRPRATDPEILDVLCSPLVPAEPLPPKVRPSARSGLVARAVCPDCRGPLTDDPLACAKCGREFEISAGTADLTARADADANRTETALRGRWNPERVATALALRARLDLPMALTCRRWDFTRDEDRRGWMPNADLHHVERGDGPGWHFQSSQTPWLVGPGIGLRGDAIAAIELTMRIHNPDFDRDAGVGQLWWLTEDDTDFGADRHIVFPVVNDGDVHDYRVGLDARSGWTEDRDIVCLRLDPVNGPCAIELLAFELIPR
ncbi:MAG: hypothetical protein KDB80_14290, partial [Planctomycetes bacterium]|nr:hypothetical protein [Planctomycetota bacterium]